MKFDIARQPLIPAFLTLLALTVAAMCGVGVHERRSQGRIAGSAVRITAETTTGCPGTPSLDPAFGIHEPPTELPDTTPGTAPGTETPDAVSESGNTASGTSNAPAGKPAAASAISDTAPGIAPGTEAPDAVSESGNTASGTSNAPAGKPAAAFAISDTAPGTEAPDAITVQKAAPASAGLAVSSPGELLDRFQTAFPGWSRLVTGILILFTGMCLGRLTVRYNLYSVGTCLAIPLYGIVACGLAAGSDFLTAFAAAALLALAVKNYSRSFCNGYAFDPLFRASLYLGLLPLVSPAALPLLLLLPLALLLFRRTVREAVVAAAGLLLPALTLCYVNWGAGGAFFAPIEALGAAFVQGPPLVMLATLPLPKLALLGFVAVLNLFALLLFLSDIYAAGTKPRFILIFCICALALTILLLAGPAATRGGIALTAVLSALLLPFLFVRISRTVALPLYLLLLCAALTGAVLQ